MPSTTRIFNVAVIGAGEVAMTVHLPTLLLCSDMFKTVALVDISRDSLDHCSAKFHVPYTYTDVTTMLEERPEVDAVMIMNANEYHIIHAVQCLQAGRHVFVEKPMSWTAKGADEIIKAEEESGKTVFVGYMRRYAEAFLRVKEMITSGGIAYVRVRDLIGSNALFTNQGGWFLKKFDDFPPEANAERQQLSDDLMVEALGARAKNPADRFAWMLLNGLATHDLSAMRELIGMPQKVLCATRSPDGRFITATFQYDGFVAFYEMGIDGVARFDAHIELYTRDKRIKRWPYIKGLPITATILSNKKNGDYSEETIRPTYEDAYTLEYKAWYAGLSGSGTIKTSAKDAKLDLEILKMVIEAI